MRVVVDANVYASALIKPEGLPSLVIKYLLNKQGSSLIACETILEEVERILWYPKIRKYIELCDHDLEKWVIGLRMVVEIVNINNLLTDKPIIEEDPDDDKYLLTAIASDANYIVSGDQHLLKLNPYLTHAILKPAEFYQLAIDKK
jgi:hypothetical protein